MLSLIKSALKVEEEKEKKKERESEREREGRQSRTLGNDSIYHVTVDIYSVSLV